MYRGEDQVLVQVHRSILQCIRRIRYSRFIDLYYNAYGGSGIPGSLIYTTMHTEDHKSRFIDLYYNIYGGSGITGTLIYTTLNTEDQVFQVH